VTTLTTAPDTPAAAPAPEAPPAHRPRRRWGDLGLRLVAGLVLVYLFIPIAVIVAFSFNEPRGKFNLTWKGFTLDNWADPFKYPQLTDALETSLHVAALSTAVAVVLGTLVAVALVRQRFRGSGGIDTFLVLPMTAPEVVMGASLLTLFIDLGWNRGFVTIVVAHVAFEVSFVAMTVKARLRGFDWTLEDAAMDLGASPTRVFLRVTLPLILPGIVAAAMLSFALSLDDFIITLFNAGDEVTFPIYIYGSALRAIPPQVQVLSSMILIVSVAILATGTFVGRRQARAATR